MNKFLTLNQVAEMFQVHRHTAKKWIQKGDLPGLKIGGSWRVDQEDLEEFIEKNKTA